MQAVHVTVIFSLERKLNKQTHYFWKLALRKVTQEKKIISDIYLFLALSTEVPTPGSGTGTGEGCTGQFSFGQRQSEAAQIGAVYQDIP